MEDGVVEVRLDLLTERSPSIVWDLIVPREGSETDYMICRLSRTNQWQSDLEAALTEAHEKEWLIVAFDRLGFRSVRTILRRGRFSLRGPRERAVLKLLAQRGFSLHARYVLWPSATRPRIVHEPSRHAARYLQRSGVLGGGRGPVTRFLARTLLLAPAIWWLTPAVALVVHREIP